MHFLIVPYLFRPGMSMTTMISRHTEDGGTHPAGLENVTNHTDAAFAAGSIVNVAADADGKYYVQVSCPAMKEPDVSAPVPDPDAD